MGESFKHGLRSEGTNAEGANMFARWMSSLYKQGGDQPVTARESRRANMRKGHYSGRALHEPGKPPHHVKAKRRARSRNAKMARRRNRAR